MRVERIGRATLYLADCADLLPDLPKVDAIITDPPYGLGDKWQGGGGSKKTSWRFNPDEARDWDREPNDAVYPMVEICEQVIVWGGNYYNLPVSRCWLVWDKKQNDEWTTGQAELAWTSLDRPIRTFRFAQCEQANEGPKVHPTQKPLALMTWCLKWVTGDSVLDPFMGSGTTGIAALRAGRSFIGVEVRREYFDLACERITNAQRQERLFA